MISKAIQDRLAKLELRLKHQTSQAKTLDDFYRDVQSGSPEFEKHYSQPAISSQPAPNHAKLI